MLVSLNSTMIVATLPRLIREFDASFGSTAWLATSCVVAMVSLQPLAGKLGDRLGRRPLFLGGLVWFAVASAAAAGAGSLAMLIVCRVQQAVAGALLMPNGVAILREAAPGERQGARMGLLGATLPLAAAAGPPLGVLLLAAGGWRAIFLVNLPLAAAPLILGCRWIPGRTRVRAPEHFDFPGAFLLTGLLVGTAGLLRSVGGGALGLVGGGALIGLLIFFLRLELRHPDPILQPRLFARASFAGPTGAVAVINLAMYMVLLTVPVLISRRGDLGEGQTGLALAPLLVAAFLSPVGGWIADRLGRRVPALLGLGMSGVSLIPLALAPARISMAVLGGALAATGAGVGLAGAALQMTATESAGQAGAGAAVGVFSASRHFGMVLSASLLGGPLVPHDGGFGGFSTIFLVASGAAFASALLSLPLPGRTALKPKAATHPATGSEGVFSLLS